MNAGNFCTNCGTALVNGVCPRCSALAGAFPPPPPPPPAPIYGSAGPYGSGAPGYGAPPPQYGQPTYSAYAGAAGSQYIGQWNWGAFLLTPWWLMNHRQIGMGILYLVLSCIPLVNISTLIMSIVYGVRGNVVAVESARFSDDGQFVAVQNAWRNWGFGITAIAIVFTFIAVMVQIASHAPSYSRY